MPSLVMCIRPGNRHHHHDEHTSSVRFSRLSITLPSLPPILPETTDLLSVTIHQSTFLEFSMTRTTQYMFFLSSFTPQHYFQIHPCRPFISSSFLVASVVPPCGSAPALLTRRGTPQPPFPAGRQKVAKRPRSRFCVASFLPHKLGR